MTILSLNPVIFEDNILKSEPTQNGLIYPSDLDLSNFQVEVSLALAYVRLIGLNTCLDMLEDSPQATHFDTFNKSLLQKVTDTRFNVVPVGFIDLPLEVSKNFLSFRSFKNAVIIFQLVDTFDSVALAEKHLANLEKYAERFALRRNSSGVISVAKNLHVALKLFKASEKFNVK